MSDKTTSVEGSETSYDSASERVLEIARARHEACSKDIRRVVFVLLSFSFFCFLSLAQPDAALVRAGGLVKIPFANVEIGFQLFLVVAPILLILIVMYLHIFINEWQQYEWVPDEEKMPYVFNLKTPFANHASNFSFYWIVPLVLFGFQFKVRGLQIFYVWVILTYVVTIALIWLFFRHHKSTNTKLFLIGWVVIASAIILPCLRPGYMVSFVPLQLSGADLARTDLTNLDLRKVRALEANLSGSNLRDLILREADFTFSNLENANLQQSDLSGARLDETILKGAYLSYANLSGANLNGASLNRADLRRANLSGANLSGASLNRADLRGAILTDANLTNVDFQETNLQGASLAGAKLSGANLQGIRTLSQSQLSEACGDKTTKIDPTLVLPECNLQ